MTVAERFFLDQVTSGRLTVTRDGVITNTATGHSKWRFGTGRYPKISLKDLEADCVRNIQCHRLVWLLFSPEKAGGKFIKHRDNNVLNYAFDNLFVSDTRAVMGSKTSGVNNAQSRFSEEDIGMIRFLLGDGMGVCECAKH